MAKVARLVLGVVVEAIADPEIDAGEEGVVFRPSINR
jgi:hypothetical protein